MNIRISTSQVQKTILAPSMQQSIEVLLLPLAELNTAIDKELQENPLLEIDEEKTNLQKEQLEQLILNRMNSLDYLPRSQGHDPANDEAMEERPITRVAPLEDYLMQQLRLEVSDEEELIIGEMIIGSLNEDGYFDSTCVDIAQSLELKDTKKIDQVLQIIQNFEPIGVASSNLKECLVTQIHYKFNGKSDLLKSIVVDYLSELGRKKFQDIARKLKISLDDVKEAARLIGTLEPKPARKFRPINTNIYIKPDISIIEDENGEYQIVINKETIPELRISRYYQNLLRKPNCKPEELEFIREKIKNALLFIRSIEQRHETIKSIAQYILTHQKEFFKHGQSALKPMTLKNVAETISRAESTVCRAVNSKYLDTPQGLYSMKYFFSQAISDNAKDTSCSKSMQQEIKDMIEEEDKSKPLTDREIALYLAEKGLSVARRTISKYRDTLKILPSNLRKI